MQAISQGLATPSRQTGDRPSVSSSPVTCFLLGSILFPICASLLGVLGLSLASFASS